MEFGAIKRIRLPVPLVDVHLGCFGRVKSVITQCSYLMRSKINQKFGIRILLLIWCWLDVTHVNDTATSLSRKLLQLVFDNEIDTKENVLHGQDKRLEYYVSIIWRLRRIIQAWLVIRLFMRCLFLHCVVLTSLVELLSNMLVYEVNIEPAASTFLFIYWILFIDLVIVLKICIKSLLFFSWEFT